MTFMAISGNQIHDMSQMRAKMEKMQSFTQGSTNLNKQDFVDMQSKMESSGSSPPADLKAIVENYESIDVNVDGVSFDELTTYAREDGIPLQGPMSG